MPPTAPGMPPKPTTDPTACFGNMSDVSVYTLHDHPWCAAAARPMRPTATQRCDAFAAKTIGVTASAQHNMAVLRAAFTDQPFLISDEDSQPPPTLPRSPSR